MSVSVDEVKALRKALESEIRASVERFEEQTGMLVTHIHAGGFDRWITPAGIQIVRTEAPTVEIRL